MLIVSVIDIIISTCQLWLSHVLGEKPQKEQFLLIEHNGDKIRIKNAVAAHWKEFAIFLHLDQGNDLDAEFEHCSHEPFRMADRIFDLYLNNKRDLNPPVNPSWKEVLEALRNMKEMELVRKLEAYFHSSSDEAGMVFI